MRRFGTGTVGKTITAVPNPKDDCAGYSGILMRMNAILLSARSVARRARITNMIHQLRTWISPPKSYEDRALKAIMGAVRIGDIVWDVGANAGIYTESFCDKVGPSGAVFAFEPTPELCVSIQNRLPHCAQLTVEQIALSDTDSSGVLVLNEGWGNHIGESAHKPESGISIAISRGDSVVNRVGSTPNIIKIDVEGFEEEVLSGLEKTLVSPSLRAVILEVHFRILEERGRREAPIRIESLLRSKGLTTSWVDSSHILAVR